MSNLTTADVRGLGLAGRARERQRQREERRGGGVLYCIVYYTVLYCTLQVVLGRQNLGQVLECRVTSKALKVILTFSTVNIFFISKYFSGAHHPARVPGRERVSLGRDDVARE